MNLKAFFFANLLFLTPLNALAETHKALGPASMEECSADSECVLAPEVFSGCFHFCKGDECKDAKDCPVINRNFENFPNCARNVPCKDAGGKPFCDHNRCAIQEGHART